MFGTGKIAECASYYFERDGEYQIVAFCCDRSFLDGSTFAGRPVVAFEDIDHLFPPEEYELFIALGYHQVNQLRRKKFLEGLAKGYALASYSSPQVQGDFTIGANSLVLDNVSIQPKAQIGNNVFIWGGAMIGHHAVVQDHCWVTGSANIGGLTSIGESTFLGLNSTIGQSVTIGERCLLGANTLVTKCLAEDSVVVVPDTEVHRLKVDQFLRLTQVFR